MTARLKERYKEEIVSEMMEQFKYNNIMQVPKLAKIVVNMGVGDGSKEPRLLEGAIVELTQITGQKPSIRKARRSISNFKLREGMQIGCMVTLRGERMYEFLDRLMSVAIPRIRDFRGVSVKSFDQFGNYTFGITDQTIFPEVDIDSVVKVRGMNITFVIEKSSSSDESRELLRKFGMPFQN